MVKTRTFILIKYSSENVWYTCSRTTKKRKYYQGEYMSLSFKLLDDFIEPYTTQEPPFGFKDAGNNSIGEITFIRTYSRVKEDGTKERWWEVCRRVIEGMYSIQKDWATKNKLPWNANKAQASAKEAFDRMFNLKWTPPGRGLHQMGGPQVLAGNAASLQNCAVVSTGDIERHNPGYVFQWGMEALMNGVGLGFDTIGGKKNIQIREPDGEPLTFVIPDTREGWAESVGLLINGYLRHNRRVIFDYSLVRPAGAPIKTFGGTASGPEPLQKLHNQIRGLFERKMNHIFDSECIVDIFNMIGGCVVAGNVRRCLPGESPIQTNLGVSSMKDIAVGDTIVTGGESARVAAKVYSGVQDIYEVRHRFGSIRATANHRVAVFTAVDEFDYKTVAQLRTGDRLVVDGYGIDGDDGTMPGFDEALHFNASEFQIPRTISPSVAWLVGLIHGDGYTGTGLEIATSDGELEVLERARAVLEESFGLSGTITPIKDKNAVRLRVHSLGFGRWLQKHVKSANKDIRVPPFIATASRESRLAYLAGIFDADGRMRRDGPVQIAATIYGAYADDLRVLLSTLGVSAVVSPHVNNHDRKFFTVDVPGWTNKRSLSGMYAHSESGKLKKQSDNTPVDFSYPYEFVTDFGHPGRNSTVRKTLEFHDSHGRHFPSPVLSVERDGMDHTWDIEVEGINRFTAHGLVVHNSAELALGEYGDDNFVELKNPNKFPERNSYDSDKPGWAWASNNSINVPVGADYERYIDRIVNNGEPGFIWLDVTRSRGRMKDAPDAVDRRVAGFNPCCVAPHTTIMTSDGPRKISEIGKEFVAVVDGKEYSASKPWISGVGDVYRLSTEEGFEIELTAEHQILTANGDWVQAKNLQPGDKIKLNVHEGAEWGRNDNEGDGYVIGQFVGDGNFSNQNKIATVSRGDIMVGMPVHTAHLKLWDIDGDDRDIADYTRAVMSKKKHRSDWSGWSAVSDRPYQQMSVTTLTYEYGIKLNRKHDVAHLESESSAFCIGFVRGLFDADGHVEGYVESSNSKGLSIRLGQSDRALLQTVQRMLLRLGIHSKIYDSKPAGRSWLPDGNGGYKYYDTKASFRLVVSADSAITFAHKIGFMHRSKAEKLNNALSWRKLVYRKLFVATVESFDYVGQSEVWDAEVDKIHAFDANGIVAHNSEQPLESFEMCTLTTVHLPNMESKDDFLRTLKFAFLYAKTVTLLATPWAETNAVMQRNRRIGLSLTGITDILDTHGMPEIVDYMESGYDEIRRWDKTYSEWLCVRESNRVTTVKPEGTVSLLSGSSPGVHWGPGGQHFLRAIRFGNGDNLLHLFRAAGYLVEPDLVSAETSVVYFPVESNAERAEDEVSMFEKIGLAAKAQTHWSDNGVSVTVSFNAETEKDLLVPALRLHEGQLKSVSFLPMNNAYYPQMPYTKITKEEYESYIGGIDKIDFDAIYSGVDNLEAVGEKYCSNDSCQI